jgi:hypothetical protein
VSCARRSGSPAILNRAFQMILQQTHHRRGSGTSP